MTPSETLRNAFMGASRAAVVMAEANLKKRAVDLVAKKQAYKKAAEDHATWARTATAEDWLRLDNEIKQSLLPKYMTSQKEPVDAYGINQHGTYNDMGA